MKNKKSLKSKRPKKVKAKKKGSLKKFNLTKAGKKAYKKVLSCCSRVTKYYLKNKYSLPSLLVAVCLINIFSWAGPAYAEITYYQANQQLVESYSKYWPESYSSLVKQSLANTIIAYANMLRPAGQVLAKMVSTSGQTLAQVRTYKLALSDTVQAYSAMFQPTSKVLVKAFSGSGEVLAVVSYAISTPARVMAMSSR